MLYYILYIRICRQFSYLYTLSKKALLPNTPKTGHIFPLKRYQYSLHQSHQCNRQCHSAPQQQDVFVLLSTVYTFAIADW